MEKVDLRWRLRGASVSLTALIRFLVLDLVLRLCLRRRFCSIVIRLATNSARPMRKQAKYFVVARITVQLRRRRNRV
jgi:hypothetical protein